MTRWVEINSGNPAYRIRGDRVVEINSGNPVYRIRDSAPRLLSDMNSGLNHTPTGGGKTQAYSTRPSVQVVLEDC